MQDWPIDVRISRVRAQACAGRREGRNPESHDSRNVIDHSERGLSRPSFSACCDACLETVSEARSTYGAVRATNSGYRKQAAAPPPTMKLRTSGRMPDRYAGATARNVTPATSRAGFSRRRSSARCLVISMCADPVASTPSTLSNPVENTEVTDETADWQCSRVSRTRVRSQLFSSVACSFFSVAKAGEAASFTHSHCPCTRPASSWSCLRLSSPTCFDMASRRALGRGPL
mmetsp:Transcript_13890/g.36010  ORF Transcript_13890/g.36010 Transcript_13890/m.36010 type:complete len:231 (+) Transcript_13890:185-877(+)